MKPDNRVRKAIEAAGGQVKLALDLGVSQQVISVWFRRGWVPLRRAAEIEHLYGIPRRDLVNPRLLDLIDPSIDEPGNVVA